MILFGCLLAFGAAVAPRVILLLAWIFSDRWALVWKDDILLPLLGIVFLPYTTIMFMLSVVVLPGGETTIEGFGWMWIILGLVLDAMKWGQMLANRKEAQARASNLYPSSASEPPTGTGSASQSSTSATAMPATTSSVASSSPSRESQATSAGSVPDDPDADKVDT